MWNENKGSESPASGASNPSDWSKKKPGSTPSLISTRLRNFRERKKNGASATGPVAEETTVTLPTTPGNLKASFRDFLGPIYGNLIQQLKFDF